MQLEQIISISFPFWTQIKEEEQRKKLNFQEMDP